MAAARITVHHNLTEHLENGMFRHVCQVCGDVNITSSPTYWNRCKSQDQIVDHETVKRETERKVYVPPSLGKRVANFSIAAVKHVLVGMPTCTQEQVSSRIAICKGCELYRPDQENPEVGICTHTSCGCNVGNELEFLNKLFWADQSCPLKKWLAELANTSQQRCVT